MKFFFYLGIVWNILFCLNASGQQLNQIVVKPYNSIEGTSVQANCKNEGDANVIFFARLEGVKFEGEINQQRYNAEKNKYILCVDPNVVLTIKITYQNNPPVTKVIKKLSGGEVVYFTIETEKPIVETVSKGEYTINSVPQGADIRIEGIPSFHEITPFTFKGYTARAYKLFLEKENYKTNSAEIVIDERKSGNRTITLSPKEGFLSLEAKSFEAIGANVFLDEQDYGTVPMEKKQFIQGKYNLRIEKTGYSTLQRLIEIVENQETKIPIKLSPIKELIVSSNVKKAEIYLDEKYIGKTPLTYNITVGYHTLEVKKDGYLPSSRNIDASENSVNSQTVNLTLQKVFKHHVAKHKVTKRTKHYALKHKIKGGPANVFLSMVMPGWGDHYVNLYPKVKRKAWYVVPTFYLLSLGAAYAEYGDYKTNYASYHRATNQSDIEMYYNNANTSYTAFQFCLGAAATFWVFDALHTVVRGSRNIHNQRNHRYSFDEQRTNFYFAGSRNTFQFGLIYKI